MHLINLRFVLNSLFVILYPISSIIPSVYHETQYMKEARKAKKQEKFYIKTHSKNK